MDSKRVLLIGGNFSPELTGIGKYNGEMIEWLAANGYDTAVVTTYPYYPEWKRNTGDSRSGYWFSKEHKIARNGGSNVVYRCPHYIPSRPSGLKRMISDFSFMLTGGVRVLSLIFKKRYDYVLCVAPPFHVGLLGLFYQKVTRAKMIYHIQDLQIDAAKELGMIRQQWLLNLMFRIEKYILRQSDYVSSISFGMINRIRTKLSREIVFFPNWVNTRELFNIPDKAPLKSMFGFDPASKLVLYSGAIGEKQGLEAVIHAAAILRNEPIRFVICGNGPYREKLQTMATGAGLDNVSFLPLQEKKVFNDFLNAADLHLVLQKKNANDLVMPSKLTGILSVGGVALVTADETSGLHRYISQHNIAVLAEPEDTNALVEGIRRGLYNTSPQVSLNARNFAHTELNIDHIMNRFANEVLSGVRSKVVTLPVKREEQVVDTHTS